MGDQAWRQTGGDRMEGRESEGRGGKTVGGLERGWSPSMSEPLRFSSMPLSSVTVICLHVYVSNVLPHCISMSRHLADSAGNRAGTSCHHALKMLHQPDHGRCQATFDSSSGQMLQSMQTCRVL